jgi:hypothetical protein
MKIGCKKRACALSRPERADARDAAAKAWLAVDAVVNKNEKMQQLAAAKAWLAAVRDVKALKRG